jgi:YjbE family integral membrane protein
MSVLLGMEFWLRLLAIGMLNLLLSGDNALVIALAVRTLPRRQRLLGQIWGALGAVVLRLVFVAAVTLLLRLPALQLVGGLILIWIALKLVRPSEGGGGDEGGRHGTSVWEAIWIIIVADVTMSLDNVLAIAAAARGELTLVALGIAMSLPLVIWGAGVLAVLMNRWTWIVWLGGGVLGYVAADMALSDPIVRRWLGESAGFLHHPVPVIAALIVTATGWWLGRAAQLHVPEDV